MHHFGNVALWMEDPEQLAMQVLLSKHVLDARASKVGKGNYQLLRVRGLPALPCIAKCPQLQVAAS